MPPLSRRTFIGTAALAAGASHFTFAKEPEALDKSTIGKTPHTKLAVNVEMWYSKRPFLDRLREAASLGFPAVEIWPWQNKDIDAVAGLTQDLGLDIAQFTAWGFTPGLNDPENHNDFVKAIKDGCKVAHRWKCPLMTVVAGNDIEGMTQDQMHANVIKGLKRAAPIA